MKHLSLIIKILVLVAVIMFGVLIYITCSGQPLVQKIDKTLPDDIQAPYEVTTRTHLYYAAEAVENDDSSVTMSGWYERINEKWVLHEGEETLPPLLRPEVKRR